MYLLTSLKEVSLSFNWSPIRDSGMKRRLTSFRLVSRYTPVRIRLRHFDIKHYIIHTTRAVDVKLAYQLGTPALINFSVALIFPSSLRCSQNRELLPPHQCGTLVAIHFSSEVFKGTGKRIHRPLPTNQCHTMPIFHEWEKSLWSTGILYQGFRNNNMPFYHSATTANLFPQQMMRSLDEKILGKNLVWLEKECVMYTLCSSSNYCYPIEK